MEKKKKVSIKITYVGFDKRYFENLVVDMKEVYKNYDTSFNSYRIDEENDYTKVYHNILKKVPDILYLDFSTGVENVTRLLKLFVAYKAKGTALVALYPQLDHEKTRDKLIGINLELGVHVNIIKAGDDFLEPMYLGMRLSKPKNLIKPKFYEKKDREGIKGEILDIGKINYITKDYFECECNLEIPGGEEITAQTQLPLDIVDSNVFLCLESQNKGCYYNRDFKHKFEPLFLDHIEEKEVMNKLEKAKFAEDTERREELIENKHKPEFTQWVEEMSKESAQKLVKVGVIDKELHLLKNLEQTGDIVFSSKVWTNANRCERDLILFHSELLVIQMDPEVNNFENIERLVKFMKLNEYEPYVLIFGCFESNEVMQEKLEYSKLITYTGTVEKGVITNLVESFESKQGQVEEELIKFTLSNEMDFSNVLIPHEIKIFHMSEYSIDFGLDKELLPGAFFKIHEPCKAYIRVVEHKESSPFAGEANIHHGIIHSLTNDEKKKLRQYLQQTKD